MTTIWAEVGQRYLRLVATSTATCLAVILLLSAAPRTCLATENALQSATQAYVSGRVNLAISILESSLENNTTSDPYPLLEFLVFICTSTYNTDCLSRQADKFADYAKQPRKKFEADLKSFFKVDDLGAEVIAAYRSGRILYSWAFLFSDSPEFEQIAPKDLGNGLIDPLTYMKLHLLASRHRLKKLEFDEAERALTRGIAYASEVTSGLSGESYYLTRALLDAISIQVQLGNPLKAIYWHDAIQPLFLQLPPRSPEYAWYKILYSELLGLFGPSDLLANALIEAIGLIQQLDMESRVREYQLSVAVARLVAVKTILGDFDGARQALLMHPSLEHKAAIHMGERFETQSDFYYALAEIFFRTWAGEKLDDRWIKIFTEPIAWSWSREESEDDEALRHFGLGLLLRESDPEAARTELLQSVRMRLERFRRTGEGRLDTFPMLGLIDRMLFLVAVPVLAETAPTDRESGNLLVQVMEALGRTLTSAIGDSLSFVAGRRTEEGRRLAHDHIMLAAQQAAYERDMLADLIKRHTGVGLGHALQTDQSKRSGPAILSDFAYVRSRVWESLQEIEQQTPITNWISLLDQLQALLKDDEVFLSLVPSASGPVRVCITRKDLFATRFRLDPEFMLDIRLIRNALTAQHPPSDVLDQQYPVEAAIRLFDVLLRDPCILPGNTVFFAPPPELQGFPLGVLLQSAPTRTKDGYELSTAKWAALDYSFSYVSSISHFLSARRSVQFAGGDLRFLGIGNPQLDLPIPGPGSQLASNRSVDLSGLKQLPETLAELSTALTALGDERSRLLTGNDATEEKVRLQPLSRYNVIQFATHGLIRDDLTGLSEAALVLTPVDPENPLNDGLLTASEIAGLELRAQLVVLSACNSANLDSQVFGSRIQGLTLALTMSGVPVIVASLWPVESATTATIMTGFMQALDTEHSLPVSSAYRLALTKYIRRKHAVAYYHPRFWAPFIAMGDGALRLTMNRIPVLEDWEVMGVSGSGEVTDAALVPIQGHLVMSIIGPPKLEKHSAILQLRDQNGQVLWQHESRMYSAGPVSASKDRIFDGLYVVAGGDTMAHVRAFSPDGALLWVRPLDSGKPIDIVEDLLPADHGGVFVLLRGDAFEEPTGEEVFDLVEIDGVGIEKRRVRVLEVAKRLERSRRGLLFRYRNGSLGIAISKGQSDELAGSTTTINEFQLLVPCFQPYRTDVFRVDPRNWIVQSEQSLENFSIRSVHMIGNRLILAGGRSEPCRWQTNAAVVEMSEKRVEEIWSDGGPYWSWASGVALTSSGLQIVITFQRLLAISERSTPLSVLADRYSRLSSLLREANEKRFEAALIVVKDYERHRRYLTSGFSTQINGMVSSNSKLFLYGSIGFAPLWVRIAAEGQAHSLQQDWAE